jgi:hypothetical protein
LGVYAGNIWLSEYPCRNWLGEAIGRTLHPLFYYSSSRGGYMRSHGFRTF